jgi:hypothetical protein
MKVRLHGEPEIWCLYPKRFSDALNFRGHPALVLERKQVLDYRITKNYIYIAVAELDEIGRVAGERFYVRVPLLFCNQVHGENLDIGALVPAPIFPKGICTAYVENAQRPR